MTDMKQIIAEMRRILNKPLLEWNGYDQDDWETFMTYENITAILDYVAELEQEIKQMKYDSFVDDEGHYDQET